MTETPSSPVDQLVFRAAVHLITSTEGAANLEDVQRFHNRTAISLLAAETGMSADQVRAAIERRPSDYFSEPAAS